MKTYLSVFLITLVFSGCAQSGTRVEQSQIAAAESPPTPTAPVKLIAEQKKALPKSNLTFAGRDCTFDCGGHEAGYEWAEEKGIDDIDDCGGKSQSFIEGCESYVEEHGKSADDENED